MLRRSTTFEQARPWAELLVATRPMVPSGAVMLLASGGWLASLLHPDFPGWLRVAVVALVLVGLAGWVSGRGFAAMGRAVAIGHGPLSADAAGMLAAGRPAWAALFAANGASLGVIWLMCARPEGWPAAVVVAGPALIGAAVAARLRGPLVVARAA